MKALITGANGQDGHYLSNLLLNKGYIVYGLIRPSTTSSDKEFEDLKKNQNFKPIYGDLLDKTGIKSIIYDISPDEIYNLAAQSHVHTSFQTPEYTYLVNGNAVLYILESLKQLKLTQKTKFYQASTSELFGKIQESIQNENTPFYPRSPYAISKLLAYWTTINYRESYGLFACNGILFNHESPLRGESFVTRKIVKAIANILSGEQEYIELGNLDAKRDWGHAKDFVRGMWLIMQQNVPEDYVLATGKTHTVRQFVEEAFKTINIEIQWTGKGIDEVGINKKNGKILIKINPEYYRPAEVDVLLGDYSKAKKQLGWEPEIDFKTLVKEMVSMELKVINQESIVFN